MNTGAIGAEREERRGAEIHIAAITAEDIPGRRQHDELQDRVAGEIEVVELQPMREGQDEEADYRTRQLRISRTLTGYRPKSPAGRKASVRRRKPNATAGAHDGP